MRFVGDRRPRIDDELLSDRTLSLIDWLVSLLSLRYRLEPDDFFSDDLHSQHWSVSFPVSPSFNTTDSGYEIA